MRGRWRQPWSAEMTTPKPEAVQLTSIDEGGFRLSARVRPGGRADRLAGVHDGALRIEVRAAPERGKANDAVVRVVAEALGLRRGDVEITAGHGGRSKTIVVRGVSVKEIVTGLEKAGIPAVLAGEP